MRKLKLLSLFLFLSVTLVSAQNNSLLIRYPAISPDGKQIAFSYQGDIWTVPSNGGNAVRLTIHEAYEAFPKWSPDGKQIAFSGARYGNNDIFVIPAAGGAPERLTYNSASDLVSNWDKDGKIYFTTAREYNQIERDPEIYAISAKGGTEWRVLDALGFEPAPSPDGRFIAFVRGGSNPIFREAYRLSAQRDVWIYDTKTKTYSKITTSDANDYLPLWGDARTIYFISANSGKYNIYRVKLDDNGKPGKEEQLTNFKDYAVRYFSITGDGSEIVFECGKDIYSMDTKGGTPQKINIQIGADYRFDPVEYKNFSNGAGDFALSPNGKLIAFAIRGEIFVKEVNKDRSKSINVSDSPFRDMGTTWLSDSTLIFTSDREGGNFELYLVKSADKNNSNIFTSLKHEIIRLTKTDEDESDPVVSPDGKKIAYTRGRGDFIVADISPDGKLTNEKALHKGWNGATGVVWSPDSKWLAYSMTDLLFNDEIYIQPADNSREPVNVSMHPSPDTNPFWSGDGSKLGFISERSNRNSDVWFVWLRKDDWEKSRQDWDEKEPAVEKKEDKKGEKKDNTIKIDLDDIHNRIVQVTSFPGNEANIAISKDGETFYYTAQSSYARGRDLYSIKWDGKDLKELTKGGQNPGNVFMDKDGKYLFYTRMGGSLTRHDLKADKPEPLPYSAKLTIDHNAERSQIFEEAWRAIRDGFYDPNFHGQNWEKLKEKYKGLCLSASTESDFRDMFNYMLGELNASHSGLYGSELGTTQHETTGLLGAELMPAKGGMKVMRVIPDSPADKDASRLTEGEIITSVDGAPVNDNVNFYSLLTNKADEKVLLTVKDKEGKEKEVAIRPIANERQLLYKEWVKNRKKLVDEYSGGKLGYIHIQGMDMPSFEVFERELTAAGYGKEGLVIDVRYNGGGSTTDYLMAVLNYKQHAYTIPRGAADNLEKEKLKFRDYYPIGERLVYPAWIKPSIAMCNEGSYSNAEIFSHAYKTLGIGKLVGIPTNGSVISTGARTLVDDSYVRLPGRGWFVKATNKNEELGPAIPDVIVENSVDYKAKGVDEQLKAAVEQLLKDAASFK